MSGATNYIPALRYDWLTRVYDPVLQLTMPERKFKTALINAMSLQPGSKVLDFGCGSLTLSIMAAQKHPETAFFGVDIDAKVLVIAQKKLDATNLPIQITQYDGARLPYPDGYFTHVMSSLVLHHLTLKQKYFALGEFRRVLKPDGELHIADFGLPTGPLQRAGFYLVQLLDGFETTNDSVENVLPGAILQTGFQRMKETGIFKTMVGTVRLIKAVNTEAAIK